MPASKRNNILHNMTCCSSCLTTIGGNLRGLPHGTPPIMWTATFLDNMLRKTNNIVKTVLVPHPAQFVIKHFAGGSDCTT
jgi:hypothetical protein